MNEHIGSTINGRKLIDTNIQTRGKKGKRYRFFLTVCNLCGREKELRLTDIKKGHCVCNRRLMDGYGDIEPWYMGQIIKRSRKKNIVFDITAKYLWDVFLEQGGKCIYSGIPIVFAKSHKATDQTASADRIISELGYIEGNIQWVHKDINNMKMSLKDERFRELCKMVANNI